MSNYTILNSKNNSLASHLIVTEEKLFLIFAAHVQSSNLTLNSTCTGILLTKRGIFVSANCYKVFCSRELSFTEVRIQGIS